MVEMGLEVVVVDEEVDKKVDEEVDEEEGEAQVARGVGA